MHRLLASFSLALGLALSSPALADELNTNQQGVMISGFDPVSYFTVGEPQQGSPDFAAEHEGATYWFTSAENLSLFEEDPVRYAPEYGGYCSYGVSIGQKFDVDPQAWSIQNGRLFLQLDPGTRVVWQEDEAENVRIADALWPTIQDLSADES